MLFDSISQIILGSLSFRCYLNATLRIKNLLFKTNFALVFCLYWVQTKFTNLMYDIWQRQLYHLRDSMLILKSTLLLTSIDTIINDFSLPRYNVSNSTSASYLHLLACLHLDKDTLFMLLDMRNYLIAIEFGIAKLCLINFEAMNTLQW